MIELGTLFNLRINAKTNVLIGFVGLWVILTVLCLWLFQTLTSLNAILIGFIATFLHFSGEFLHQLGHARAARRTGYPMSGITFLWVLGMSRYPSNEGELTPETHIRRAMGGPIFSFIIAIASSLLTFLLRQLDVSPIIWGLALFFTVVNLFVFTIGALLPLGFTDGSTILRYLPRRQGK